MTHSPHGDSRDAAGRSRPLERSLELTRLRDWCMDRLSVLSLRRDLDDARSLTSEHLEMLMETNAFKTLWMRVDGQILPDR